MTLVKRHLEITGKPKFRFYLYDDVNLTDYVTTEKMAYKKESAMPTTGGHVLILLIILTIYRIGILMS